MRYLIFILLLFIFGCNVPETEEVNEIEETIENSVIPRDSITVLPAMIESTDNNKLFQVVEIIDSTYIKAVIFDDTLNRADIVEVENVVMKIRERFDLTHGIEETGKVFYKFYESIEQYKMDELPSVATTFYNNLQGRTGMDIYWGRSPDITKIILTPERVVIQ